MFLIVIIEGHFLYVTVPDGGLTNDWAAFQSPRLEPTNSSYPCKVGSADWNFMLRGTKSSVPYFLIDLCLNDMSKNNIFLPDFKLIWNFFNSLSTVDGDVHSPVWAEVRWFDCTGGRWEDLPSVGEGRSSGRCLGEGGGGDCHQLCFPSEYLICL